MKTLSSVMLLASAPLLVAGDGCPIPWTVDQLADAVAARVNCREVVLSEDTIKAIAAEVRRQLKADAGTPAPPATVTPAPDAQSGGRLFNSYEQAAVAAQQQDLPLLVSFSMPRCPACDRLKAIKGDGEVEAVLGAYVVCNIDATVDGRTTKSFGIQTVPTEIVRFRGREIGRHTISSSKSLYIDWHSRTLAKARNIRPQ